MPSAAAAGTGPLYMLCWPLYSSSPWSPLICSTVPFTAALAFALAGSGAVPDIVGLIPAVTRCNDRKELLRGPFQYGLVHAAVTLLMWRHSPAGAASLAVLCGGDGLAEVVGKAVTSPPLPYNREKTMAGTLGCFVGGTVAAYLLLRHFSSEGMFGLPGIAAAALARGAVLCGAVGAAVESAAWGETDNVMVTAAAAAAARLYFGF
jgi:phytol kinase